MAAAWGAVAPTPVLCVLCSCSAISLLLYNEEIVSNKHIEARSV